MNEATLRAWTRGELPPKERRAVTRWIVTCTDPRLGPLLHGLTIEAAEEAAERRLAERGGLWRRLSRAWHELLDAGLAELTAGARPEMLLAALSDESDRPALRLEDRDGVALVVLRLPVDLDGLPAALYLTDDDGGVYTLQTRRGEREHLTSLPEPTGPRPTVWAVIGHAPTAPAPAMALTAALDDPSLTVLALRVRGS